MTTDHVDVFVAVAREADLKVSVDAAETADGEWFIDVARGGFRTTVSWCRRSGFGLFTDEVGYGDRPSETFLDAPRAVARLGQLYAQWKSQGSFSLPSLGDLRQLLNTSQEELGRLARLKQSAISRFEGRDDVKLSSLVAYVAALGGRVEVRVHFDDMDLALNVPRT